MQALYKGSKLDITIEAKSHKELFEELAKVQEVFDESACGLCGKSNIAFTLRNAKDAKSKEITYYELRCKDCLAKLAFGVNNDKSDSLFPKRKLKLDNGNYRPAKEDDTEPFEWKSRGWHKYDNKKAASK